MLDRLQHATHVKIGGRENISSQFVADLLSSAPNLVSVSIPKIRNEIPTEISTLDLPNLTFLWPESPPQDISGDSTLFFRKLKARKIELLRSKKINPEDFQDLEARSCKSLKIDSLSVAEPNSDCGESAVASLIDKIKDWKELHTLDLRLPVSTSSSTWSHLLYLMTPFTRENVQSGLRYYQLLPKLKEFYLEFHETGIPMNGLAPASFVAARLALKRGSKDRFVVLAGSGDLASALTENIVQEEMEDPEPRSSAIETLGTYLPIQLDVKSQVWPEENVKAFDVEDGLIRVPSRGQW